MIRSALAGLIMLMVYLPATSQVAARTAVGEGAEFIMKYGLLLKKSCGKLDEMQWKFCTSMVQIKNVGNRVSGYAGTWECSYHQNYLGSQLNLICIEYNGSH